MTFSKRFVLTLSILGIAYTSFAQDLTSESYYRHFYAQVKNLSQEEFSALQTNAKSINHIELVDRCETNPGILFKVNANYPKRIKDISDEIERLISNQIPKRRIVKVSMVKDQDKTTYCK